MSWFPPPAIVEATVFTTLPSRFAAPRASLWADANKGGAHLGSFLEGPCLDAAGDLYVTDIPFGRVFRIDGDREWHLVAEYDGWPNGLTIDAGGRMLVADYRNGLMELNPADGSVRPVLATAHSEGFKGLNDVTPAASGEVYFTDQGQTGMHDRSGRVYRLSPDGRLTRLLDNCPSPNGLALNPEQSHLYVAMTRGCEVWRIPIGHDIVTKANVFTRTPGGVSGPDGLAVDEAGGLFVCDPGHGSVWRVDAWGVPTHRIVSPAGRTVTNLAFGGGDRTQLFITDSETGRILTAQAPFAGLPLPSPLRPSKPQPSKPEPRP